MYVNVMSNVFHQQTTINCDFIHTGHDNSMFIIVMFLLRVDSGISTSSVLSVQPPHGKLDILPPYCFFCEYI